MADKASTRKSARSKSGKIHHKSTPISLPEEQPGTSKQASTRGKESRDKTKSSKASECDERRRDRALQKICAQSANRPSNSVPPQGEDANIRQQPTVPSSGLSGEQLSLDNPDLAIDNPDIWVQLGLSRLLGFLGRCCSRD